MKKLILILSFVLYSVCSSQVWNQRLNGISMWSLGYDYQGNIYAGASGTVKSIYKSTNGGENWTEVFSGGLSNILSVGCDSSNNVYAAYGSAGVLKSTNGGLNWTVIPSVTFGSNTVQSVRCGKNGYVYVGTTLGGIYRSTDNGATFPDNALAGSNIVFIFFDRYNSDIVFAGASAGSGNNGIYRSSNAGSNWSNIINNGTNCWGIIQKSPNELYSVTTSTGYPVSKSTDGGLNWFTISNLSGAMRGMTLDNSGRIYSSGNGGVFRSTNNGTSFSNFNFTFTSNQCLAFGNRILVAASGTSNGGIWYTIDSTISGISGLSPETAQDYYLVQNYPNPFNPRTTIIFGIPGTERVQLKVYNLQGKEVAVLADGLMKYGEHRIEFSCSNLPSGIYFYRLDTENYTETKKMTVIK